MLDLPQTLILVVIVILTTLLVIIGIQIIFILRDIRQSTKRFNTMLVHTEHLITSLNGPVANLTHMADGLRQGVKAVEMVTSYLNHKKSESMLQSLTDDSRL